MSAPTLHLVSRVFRVGWRKGPAPTGVRIRGWNPFSAILSIIIYLAFRGEKISSASRQAGIEEIEITSEMIEAGARKIMVYSGSGWVSENPPHWTAGELAQDIFRAMIVHRSIRPDSAEARP